MYLCIHKKSIFYIMINRTMLRIRVVQILFAYYSSNTENPKMGEKNLVNSFQDTYDLYFQLLLLAVEITRLAQNKVEIGKSKYLPTQEELYPNTRFAENSFIQQLQENIDLAFHMKENKGISWVDYSDVVAELYKQIQQEDFYKAYMEADVVSYAEDKALWRKIFSKVIDNNPIVEETLESINIYWPSDLSAVCSFVVKTIKRFDAEKGANQDLLPMFTDSEDEEFALQILQNAIQNHDQYKAMIDEHTKNWDVERLAFMDIIIMLAAIAEIMSVPTIPVNVTLNEYMEIAKEYSTEKSAAFINGVLDDIVKRLKNEKKLMKAVLL